MKKRIGIFLLMLAVALNSSAVASTKEATVMDKPQSLLVLGDSIADGYMDRPGGYMASAREACYGTLIAQSLGLTGEEYHNNAVSGWRTVELLQNIEEKTSGISAPDLVAISIGGNDVMWSLQQDSTIKYDMNELLADPDSAKTKDLVARIEKEQANLSERESYKNAIAQAVSNIEDIFDYLLQQFPDTHIVIQTVYNPLDANEKLCIRLPVIENLNAAIRQAAAAYPQVTVLDVFEGFHAKGDTYISSDFIHPNETGHAAIAAMYEQLWTRAKGDVDGNREITASDALLVLQAATQKLALREDALAAADINANGQADAGDALQILQFATQKIAAF